MDLNKAQRKIRNAWIAGLVPGVCSLSFIVPRIVASEVILLIAFSFGLSFGVSKRRRSSAIALFMCVICVAAFLFSFIHEIGISGVYIGVCFVSSDVHVSFSNIPPRGFEPLSHG